MVVRVGAAGSNVKVNVCQATLYPPPVITAPHDNTVTYASSFLIHGTATPNVTVYAYRNNQQVGFIEASNTGEYAISIALQVGQNEIKTSTNNDCVDPPSYSNTVTIERRITTPPTPTPPTPNPPSPTPNPPLPPADPDPDPGPGDGAPPVNPGDVDPSADGTADPDENTIPTDDGNGGPRGPGGSQGDGSGNGIVIPVILDPNKHVVVNQPYIVIYGRAAPGVTVSIWRGNDLIAQVLTDDRGYFKVGITLKEGNNRISATTGKDDTFRRSKTIPITYKPVPKNDIFRNPIVRVAVGGGAAAGTSTIIYAVVDRSVFIPKVKRLYRRIRWRNKKQ